MASYEIWHNPRCSKSRQTLALLEEAGASPQVVLYLEAPPTKKRLQEVLALLALDDPRALMRTKEPLYRELGLAKEAKPAALIAAMVEHPSLIERPVVIRDGKRAVLGRPPENVRELL